MLLSDGAAEAGAAVGSHNSAGSAFFSSPPLPSPPSSSSASSSSFNFGFDNLGFDFFDFFFLPAKPRPRDTVTLFLGGGAGAAATDTATISAAGGGAPPSLLLPEAAACAAAACSACFFRHASRRLRFRSALASSSLVILRSLYWMNGWVVDQYWAVSARYEGTNRHKMCWFLALVMLQCVVSSSFVMVGERMRPGFAVQI